MDEPSQTFCEVLGELTTTGSLRRPLSSFGLSIIAHTLYRYVSKLLLSIIWTPTLSDFERLCSDAAATDVICSTSSVSADSRYRLTFSANFKQYGIPLYKPWTDF